MNKLDLINKRFGKLLVKNYQDIVNKNSRYLCECDCGKQVVVFGLHLKSGNTRSCGCLKKENKSNLKHGLKNTRFYRIWRGIKTRCLNKNHADFRYYGQKGVTISKDWLDFENFRRDMYEQYLMHVANKSEQDTTIERIDNNLGYCKENCRWSTWKEQYANKLRNKSTTHNAIIV